MTLSPLPYETPATAVDMEIMFRQLGRTMRGVVSIARRCACGAPAVVRTLPRLPDGSPFPTSFYLTLPSITEEISRVEAAGTLAEWTQELSQDPQAQEQYRAAHEHFLQRRAELGDVQEIRGISSGGMPERVKCLHALAGHALAEGEGLNPYGDRVLAQIHDLASIDVCRCEVTPQNILAQWQASNEPHLPRVAAIDCGTNSIRLLIAEAVPDSSSPLGFTLRDLERRMEIVRLGYAVDRTGRIDDEAMDRTLTALRDFKAQIDAFAVAPADVRFTATSATRDAENRKEFILAVRSVLGITPEVIPGSEEASLSFIGAVASLPAPVALPALVVDIGGGSTELVLGSSAPEASVSLNMGSVRITERHLHEDPPGEDAIAAAVKDIDSMLDSAEEVVDLSEARSLVGVAGTVTTMTAAVMQLDAYNPEASHGHVTNLQEFAAACREMVRMPRGERAEKPYIHPGRVDVLGAGALIWERILQRTADQSGITEVVTSEHDILDGIAISVVQRSARTR